MPSERYYGTTVDAEERPVRLYPRNGYPGRGPGGERRENMMLRHLDEWRYTASEGFEPSPAVLAEVAKLERLTDDGRRLTEEIKRSA